MRFPQVSGTNLLRRKVTLPDDLQGSFNILFVAFQQRQQALIDAWVPRVRQLEQSFPVVQFYEIPVIQKLNFLSQTFINEGMRAGIPNHTTREKTITLYLDKLEFRRILEIPHEETIWVLVLDREGNVLWRAEGAYSVEKGDLLERLVQDFLK
jgi:hypothetical protein